MNFNEITNIIIYDSDDSHLNIRLWEYKTSRNLLFLFLRILLFQLLPPRHQHSAKQRHLRWCAKF